MEWRWSEVSGMEGVEVEGVEVEGVEVEGVEVEWWKVVEQWRWKE